MQNTVNVDADEIEKFSRLAAKWWDKYGEFKPLHDINPLRLDYIDRNAALAGKTVVDVGCGGGILADAMARKGAEVLGIDLAEKSLQAARLHALEAETPRVSYRAVAAEALAAQEPASFDVVTCMEMLEHVPDPAAIVAACAALVKPGGQVFFSTLNRNPKSWLMAIAGAEYALRLLPQGTHDYTRFIRPSELAAFCRAAGLSVQRVSGLHYNPLTRRCWLTPDASVNYMLSALRPA